MTQNLKLTDAKIRKIDAIMKRLGFSIQENSEELPTEDENYCILNNNYVCMIHTKNLELRKLFKKYYSGYTKKPDLNYITNEEVKARYSSFYLKNAVELINTIQEEDVIVQAQKSYPIRVYNEHIGVILAPKGD